MHGGKEFKSDIPPLKNEEYADQLKDNRAVKKCREKKGFHIILTFILIVFLVCKPGATTVDQTTVDRTTLHRNDS